MSPGNDLIPDGAKGEGSKSKEKARRRTLFISRVLYYSRTPLIGSVDRKPPDLSQLLEVDCTIMEKRGRFFFVFRKEISLTCFKVKLSL